MVATRATPRSTKYSTPEPAIDVSDYSALSAPRTRRAHRGGWSHTPSTLTLVWLAVSLPLVIWDFGYVLLRPHTFPGGALHWPLYVPYALYGTIDYNYSPHLYHAGSGFCGAQSAMNVIETAMYLVYVGVWWRAAAKAAAAGSTERASIGGRDGALAVLFGFSAAVMTIAKTMLYALNEYYGNWENIAHNDLFTLVFLWILPNGPWLVVPNFIIYELGSDIIDGLAVAPSIAKKHE